MVDQDDGQAPEARPPGVEDLIDLCRRLNEEGARYIVIGGMAIIQAGFVRATEDIDLLVDTAPNNVERLRANLSRRHETLRADVAELKEGQGRLEAGPARCDRAHAVVC